VLFVFHAHSCSGIGHFSKNLFGEDFLGKDNHFSDAEIEALHQPASGAKGKGCLVRHQERTEDHQCSHQWQARVKAEDDRHIYDYPKYKKFCGSDYYKSEARITESKNPFPQDYAKKIKGVLMNKRPTHEGKEWDVGKNDNFNHFIKPYWHNAHHIIPNGALKNAISETADSDARLPNIIRYCLLKASYNLNDKINMIILPQGKLVAEALGLPRHLKGDEVGPDEEGEFFSHVDYSDTIQLKLDKIMNNYKKSLAEALKEKHPQPPTNLSKQMLEDLSKEIYSALIKLSPQNAGKALSELIF
jgi:hypothetical protein